MILHFALHKIHFLLSWEIKNFAWWHFTLQAANKKPVTNQSLKQALSSWQTYLSQLLITEKQKILNFSEHPNWSQHQIKNQSLNMDNNAYYVPLQNLSQTGQSHHHHQLSFLFRSHHWLWHHHHSFADPFCFLENLPSQHHMTICDYTSAMHVADQQGVLE